MSRPGSERRISNAAAAKPAADQNPDEVDLSSADPYPAVGIDGAPPFGDWRDQLRERVKEIRARKLADKRPSERAPGGLEGSSATHSEVLPPVAEQTVSADEGADPRMPGDPAADGPDLANLMDALLNPPEGVEPLISSPPTAIEPGDARVAEWEVGMTTESLGDLDVEPSVDGAEDVASDVTNAESTPIGEPVMSGHEEDVAQLDALGVEDPPVVEPSFEEEEEEEEEEEAAAPPPLDAVPLFQDEFPLIDDNPLSEIVQEAPDPQPAEPRAETRTPPPLDGFRTEMPSWAKVETSDESIAPVAPAAQPLPPPDLDAIPNELSDVDIPSWTLPRQHGDRDEAAFAANAPGQLNAERLLAGTPLEQASPEATTRPSREGDDPAGSEALDPPAATVNPVRPETPKQPESLVQNDVHIVGEYSASAPVTPATSFEDLLKAPKHPAPMMSTTPTETAAPVVERPASATEPMQAPPPTRLTGESAPTAAATNRGGTADPAEPFHTPPSASPSPPASTRPVRAPESRWPATAGQSEVPAPEQPSWVDAVPVTATESAVGSPAATSEAGRPEASATGRFPGLFDPAADAAVEAHQSPTDLEPQPETDTSMEWDLEAPSDPDTILDAQRDPMDPTAPMSDRLFSALADALVLTTIAVLLMFGGASVSGTGAVSFVQAAPIPFAAAWLVFGLSYGIFFIGTCGQTLGKMAMRIRVIGSNRFRVGYGKATVRAFTYAAAMLPAGLGLIPAFTDTEHRALHDRLSGTRVVKA